MLTTPMPATAGPVQAGTTAATPQAEPVRVTLITGDEVAVNAHGTALTPAPGRAGIPVMRQVLNGDQYVIPADALPLLRSGRLDQRLFGVTAPQRFGYTGRRDLPLLVQYPKSGASRGPAGARAAVGAKARVSRDLDRVGMLAVHARSDQAALWSSLTSGTTKARTLRAGVQRVYLDGKLRSSDDVSNPQVGAPTAWQQATCVSGCGMCRSAYGRAARPRTR